MVRSEKVQEIFLPSLDCGVGKSYIHVVDDIVEVVVVVIRHILPLAQLHALGIQFVNLCECQETNLNS